MGTRVNDAALVSRVSRLRRSRARALLSLNLRKKRDCSQSTVAGVGTFFYQSILLIHDVRKIPNNSLYVAANVKFNLHSSPLRMKKILHNEITEAPFSHAASVSAAAEVTRGSDLTET